MFYDFSSLSYVPTCGRARAFTCAPACPVSLPTEDNKLNTHKHDVIIIHIFFQHRINWTRGDASCSCPPLSSRFLIHLISKWSKTSQSYAVNCKLVTTAKCASVMKVSTEFLSPFFHNIMHEAFCAQRSGLANYTAEILFFFLVFDTWFIFRVCSYSFGSFDCGFGL